jgi:hypothetical protein
VLDKLLFVKLEVDYKAETIPSELLRTTLATCKLTDGITHSPRSGKGRRELGEGAGVLAQNLRSGFPIVEGEPESNLFLESDIADKNGPVESGRTGPGKRNGLDVDVGVGVGGVGKWSRLIGIDDGESTLNSEGGWAGRVGEGVSWRFYLCLGFSLFTSRPRDINRLAGPVVDADWFKTVIGLCKVDVFVEVGGSGSRLST